MTGGLLFECVSGPGDRGEACHATGLHERPHAPSVACALGSAREQRGFSGNDTGVGGASGNAWAELDATIVDQRGETAPALDGDCRPDGRSSSARATGGTSGFSSNGGNNGSADASRRSASAVSRTSARHRYIRAGMTSKLRVTPATLHLGRATASRSHAYPRPTTIAASEALARRRSPRSCRLGADFSALKASCNVTFGERSDVTDFLLPLRT